MTKQVEIVVAGKVVSRASTPEGLARAIRNEAPTPKVRGTRDALDALGMYESPTGLLIEWQPGRFAECELKAPKITTFDAAYKARESSDPALRTAADAYFARRNLRSARREGRPLSKYGRTAQLARSA